MANTPPSRSYRLCSVVPRLLAREFAHWNRSVDGRRREHRAASSVPHHPGTDCAATVGNVVKARAAVAASAATRPLASTRPMQTPQSSALLILSSGFPLRKGGGLGTPRGTGGSAATPCSNRVAEAQLNLRSPPEASLVDQQVTQRRAATSGHGQDDGPSLPASLLLPGLRRAH